MSELRLMPAAATAWLVTLAVLSGVPGLAAGCAVALLGLLAAATWSWAFHPGWPQRGQAILTGAVGTAAAALTWVRSCVARVQPAEELVGTLVADPKKVAHGAVLVRVRVSGHPAVLPVFLGSDDSDAAGVDGEVEGSAGCVVRARVRWQEEPGVKVSPWVGHAQPQRWDIEEPTGFFGWVAHVRASLRAASQAHVGESSQGLVPGMVLGDTSLQGADESQAYIDTGLSHLSAVSGSNMTVVISAAFLLARALGLGPRVQVAAAGACLVVFVGLVGPEPSVLRAAVTGVVGLLAVVGSARVDPAHGLCMAVIALVLWDSDLACQWGFALSVAATAGIIAVYPLVYRALANRWAPDLLTRAVSVAVAADAMTMPLIAAMAQRVSVVSVVANVLVSPAVAPVTILGLLAALVALLPGGIEAVLLRLIEPCTWWVNTVATCLSGSSHATVQVGVLWVMVGYGWLLWLLAARRPRGAVMYLAGVGAALLWF